MTAQPSIISHPAARPRAANLVTIASGKGGVGKTWLAVSLAHSIANSGRRVLVFDGDIGLANVDIQLGLVPEHDLGHVIGKGMRLADAVTPVAGCGFDVLAGQSGSGSLARLAEPRLIALRDELLATTRGYDLVLMDLGAGLEGSVPVLAQAAARTLVITTDEPTSLTDAYAFVKLRHRQDRQADIRIVVNQAKSKQAGERTYAKLLKACQTFLKISPPLAGIVRHDAKVGDAIRHQASLLVRHPNSAAAADVETIARRLLDGG